MDKVNYNQFKLRIKYWLLFVRFILILILGICKNRFKLLIDFRKIDLKIDNYPLIGKGIKSLIKRSRDFILWMGS